MQIVQLESRLLLPLSTPYQMYHRSRSLALEIQTSFLVFLARGLLLLATPSNIMNFLAARMRSKAFASEDQDAQARCSYGRQLCRDEGTFILRFWRLAYVEEHGFTAKRSIWCVCVCVCVCVYIFCDTFSHELQVFVALLLGKSTLNQPSVCVEQSVFVLSQCACCQLQCKQLCPMAQSI